MVCVSPSVIHLVLMLKIPRRRCVDARLFRQIGSQRGLMQAPLALVRAF